MMQVRVRTPCKHGARRYQPGEVVDMPDAAAHAFMSARVVEPLTSENEPSGWAKARRMYLDSLDDPTHLRLSSQVPHLRVGWIQDTPARTAFGAEASNAEVVRVGRILGFEVDILYPGFLPKEPRRLDVLVVNNVRKFATTEQKQLASWCLEQRMPFVRYEHDYGFCKMRNRIACDGDLSKCGACSHHSEEAIRADELYRALYRHARLAVFISPLQRAITERALGKVPAPVYELTPPVNTKTFAPVPGVEREPDLAVCTAGQLPAHKGREAVMRWADEHPEWRVECYAIRGGKVDGKAQEMAAKRSNVTLHPCLDHGDLARVYSRAAKVLCLPTAPEPAGRTPVEGALCGAEPVVNDRVGCSHFELPWSDRAALAKRIEEGVVGFWKAMEAAL